MLQLMFSVALAALLIVAVIAVVEFREIWKYPVNKPVENPHVERPGVR